MKISCLAGRRASIITHFVKEGLFSCRHYIEVDDINECLERIEKNGGNKAIGPIKLPTGQEFAWFIDVAGNTVGLITKKE